MVKKSNYKQSRFGNLCSSSSDRPSLISDVNQNSSVFCSVCGSNTAPSNSFVIESSNLVILNTDVSKNKGHQTNRRKFDYFHISLIFLVLIENAPLLSDKLKSAWDSYSGKIQGSTIMIVLALNILIAFILRFSESSLTNSCNKVCEILSLNGNKVISRKSLMYHFQRFAKNPDYYSISQTVFPPKMGRRPILSEHQIQKFVTRAKQRLAQKSHQFPTLFTFSKIAESMFGFSPSLTSISRIFKVHSIKFGSFEFVKGGTRYHDSEIVLKERVDFILKKIWCMAWESISKVTILVHDESWINEKPSSGHYWGYAPPSGKCSITPGKKINGRRLAFSSLYSLSDGLLNGVSHDDLMNILDSVIRFKQDYDNIDDLSVDEVFEIANRTNLRPSEPLSIDSKNNMIVPNGSDKCFFSFFCATARANKGIPKQMDSPKFLWSIEEMVRKAAETVHDGVTIVLQLGNATYHREAASEELLSIIHPYPLINSSLGTTPRTCMLDKLREWNIKPAGTSIEWFNPIPAIRRKITVNTSAADKRMITRHRERISTHKKQIISTYRMAPNYRYRKTKVEALMESISEELEIPIVVLWGARGHSELSEIESSWSFMKNFAISMNPQSAKQTKRLLELSRLLDYPNRQSWRDSVLVNMECYLKHGYFDRIICRTLQKTRKSIVASFRKRYEYIVKTFDFSEAGYIEYTNWISKSIVTQLTYDQILSIDY